MTRDKGLPQPADLLRCQGVQDNAIPSPKSSSEKEETSVESSQSCKPWCSTDSEKLGSSCSFYLESPSTAEPAGNGTVLSEGESGVEKEETRLVSSLRKLDLQQEDAGGLSTLSNGCLAADSVPPQSQSNGYLFKDSAKEISPSSGRESDTSQGPQSKSKSDSCFDASSTSDTSLPCENKLCSNGSVGLEASPLAKSCQEDVEKHGQYVANGSMESSASDHSCPEENTPHQSLPSKTQHDAQPVTHEDDSVFYDKADGVKSSDLPCCPTRTKSAPSFSSLSDKCKLGNEENFSSDEVTRGRSLFRDKVTGLALFVFWLG